MISRKGIVLLGVLWAAATVVGFGLLASYKSTPGPTAATPEKWPAQSSLVRGAGPTLVMFAHPMCPCTRASLTELTRLLERLHGRRLAVQLVFDLADGSEETWRGSELFEKARAVPGLEVIEDHGGQQAALFGAETSGQVVLYDAAGVLRFRGGLTIARGHEGESPGAARIAALLKGDEPGLATAPVFGCSLEGPQPQP